MSDTATSPDTRPRSDSDLEARPDAEPTLGLRERKKLRTETDLKDATLRLTAARGWDQVTIDDIAAEVEVSKTTFYRYFESKEDALLGSSTEKAERLRAALDERPADEPTLAAVRHALMTSIRSYEHDREASLLRGRMIRETPSLLARNLEHQAALEAVLAGFVAERLDGEDDTELRSRIVAAIVVATLRATVDYWRDTDGHDDLNELMDDALAMLAEKRSALAVHE